MPVALLFTPVPQCELYSTPWPSLQHHASVWFVQHPLTISIHQPDLYNTPWPSLQLRASGWFVPHPLAISSTPSPSVICAVQTDNIFNRVTRLWFVQYALAISSTPCISLICTTPTDHFFNSMHQYDLYSTDWPYLQLHHPLWYV